MSINYSDVIRDLKTLELSLEIATDNLEEIKDDSYERQNAIKLLNTASSAIEEARTWIEDLGEREKKNEIL